MRLAFTKMHGLGNDFVVLNGYDNPIDLNAQMIRHLADRHTGIGCDQLLLVEKPSVPDVDFDYRIFNADGGEVEQCGNGARCFAKFVTDQGLTTKSAIPVHTNTGNIVLYCEDDGMIKVDMGVPRLQPSEIPFIASQQAAVYMLEAAGHSHRVSAVSMGNPHVVLQVEDVDTAPVDILGALIESHERFPQRVNVGFMQVMSRQHIRLRVFERGVGETRACGTGACAAAVAGCLQSLVEADVTVSLPGGDLSIHWQGEGKPVWMRGPATTVFDGTIDL